MRYVVRYLPAGSSSVESGTWTAESATELRRTLESHGNTVLSLREVRVRAQRGSFDVAGWCQELRTLIQAGMTVVEAIETIAVDDDTGSSGDSQRGEVHRQLLNALRQGQALSGAMRSTGAFPEVLVASVTASERSSGLGEALDDYLRYEHMLAGLRRQLVSAAMYPAIVVSLGTLISIFLLLVVIPRFSRMYVDHQQSLSWATHGVLWVSQVLQAHMQWLLSLLAGLVGLAVWAFRQGWWRAWAAAWVEAIAPLRRRWDQFRLAKLYQALAMLLRGGYSLIESLEVCRGMRLGGRISQGLVDAQRAVGQGQSASSALQEAGLTELVTYRLLIVGERGGRFDLVLQAIADRHAQAFELFVQRATRVVEPLLLLVVALIVGGIVVMMYMPIFDMAGQLGGGR